MKNQVPTFRQIYFNDTAFKSLLSLFIFPLIFFGAVYLAEPSSIFFLPYCTLPLSALGLIFGIFRYISIQSTFRDGINVKCKLLSRENIVTVSSKKRSYYVTIGYRVHGVEYQQQIQLPNAPYMFGINHENQEFDLVLKESSPLNVFIKHVYLDYDPTIPSE